MVQLHPVRTLERILIDYRPGYKKSPGKFALAMMDYFTGFKSVIGLLKMGKALKDKTDLPYEVSASSGSFYTSSLSSLVTTAVEVFWVLTNPAEAGEHIKTGESIRPFMRTWSAGLGYLGYRLHDYWEKKYNRPKSSDEPAPSP